METIQMRKGGSRHSQPQVHATVTCSWGPESAGREKDPGTSQARSAPAQSQPRPCMLAGQLERQTLLTDSLLQSLRRVASHLGPVIPGRDMRLRKRKSVHSNNNMLDALGAQPSCTMGPIVQDPSYSGDQTRSHMPNTTKITPTFTNSSTHSF